MLEFINYQLSIINYQLSKIHEFTMGLVQNFRMMALYNQRMNKQLLDCCSLLSTELLEKETHTFFHNIISYWNHLLFGDLILLGRLGLNEVGQLSLSDFSLFPDPKSPQDIYFTSLEGIIPIRKGLDELIINYCNNLTDSDCELFINYKTTEGKLVTKEVSVVTQHIFNHQTHHRGQLTCILSQFGMNYGCMDLPVIISNE